MLYIKDDKLVATGHETDGFILDESIIYGIIDIYEDYTGKQDFDDCEGFPEPLYVEGKDEEADEMSDLHLSISDDLLRCIFIQKDDVVIDFCNITEFMLSLSRYIIDNQDSIEDLEASCIDFAEDFLEDYSEDKASDDDCRSKCPGGPSEKCAYCSSFQNILKKIYENQGDVEL